MAIPNWAKIVVSVIEFNDPHHLIVDLRKYDKEKWLDIEDRLLVIYLEKHFPKNFISDFEKVKELYLQYMQHRRKKKTIEKKQSCGKLMREFKRIGLHFMHESVLLQRNMMVCKSSLHSTQNACGPVMNEHFFGLNGSATTAVKLHDYEVWKPELWAWLRTNLKHGFYVDILRYEIIIPDETDRTLFKLIYL
jgi:hypothetical protein